MTNHDVLTSIRRELQAGADEKIQQSGKRFFKEEVRAYGFKTALVGKMAKQKFNGIKDLDKAAVFALCEELWKSGYLEESFIACNWSYFLHKNYEPTDFQVFENWLKSYVTNWASCDTLCNHTIGEFIEMYPDYISSLKTWTKSENRWVRRGAAVTLIIPARKGKFLSDILEIASALLTDADDLVQKGYGWMLKSASQAHQKEIFDYVVSKKDTMPRTALRYAIEKMPEKLRKEAMKRG
ncbi:DNA alkylation repair protein [Mariniphaga sediminis]|uniref:DNA alkylation repair protein n=1 Tax=Mariniphaga sediminis TaxID=1628158 RepID=A0A399CZI7_9BACT|nr:DNA alkylation repair protein [Mariniphaga sediminis]RIH65175.1 DNA alkylation repair protein [Mariniphaga sediminis]